jgi:hypothetical protein
MATPFYKGAGQPAVDNGGFFAGIGSWFGGSAPAYAGKGQPSAGSGSYASAPAYKPAPVAPVAPTAAIAPNVTVIDGEPMGPDSIALVIPRDLAERLISRDLSLIESQQ